MPLQWYPLDGGYTLSFQFSATTRELYIHVRAPGFRVELGLLDPNRGEQWTFNLSLADGSPGQLPLHYGAKRQRRSQ